MQVLINPVNTAQDVLVSRGGNHGVVMLPAMSRTVFSDAYEFIDLGGYVIMETGTPDSTYEYLSFKDAVLGLPSDAIAGKMVRCLDGFTFTVNPRGEINTVNGQFMSVYAMPNNPDKYLAALAVYSMTVAAAQQIITDGRQIYQDTLSVYVNAENKSMSWAINPEGVHPDPEDTTSESAKTWAGRSQASAVAAAASAGSLSALLTTTAIPSLAPLVPAADRIAYYTGASDAALTPLTAFARTLLDDTSQAAMRATLGLTPGTNVQAFHANLTALAGLVGAANKLPYFTGAGAMAHTDLTAFARTLLDDADQAAMRTTLGLVPTTGNRDTTAGRVMTVGDYGWPYSVVLTASDNLDSINTSGSYFNPSASNTTGNNYPVAVAGSLLHQQDNNANRGTQVYITYGTNITYTRSKGPGGAWSAWTMQYAWNNILGQVSQALGVPTGAIIERGSSANGQFIRLADGTQICTHTLTMTRASAGRMSSAWTFPAAFADITSTVLSGIAPAQSGAYTNITVANLGQFNYLTLTETSVSFGASHGQDGSFATDAVVTSIKVLAIGRWFV